jgi:hypothetical protein
MGLLGSRTSCTSRSATTKAWSAGVSFQLHHAETFTLLQCTHQSIREVDAVAARPPLGDVGEDGTCVIQQVEMRCMDHCNRPFQNKRIGFQEGCHGKPLVKKESTGRVYKPVCHRRRARGQNGDARAFRYQSPTATERSPRGGNFTIYVLSCRTSTMSAPGLASTPIRYKGVSAGSFILACRSGPQHLPRH